MGTVSRGFQEKGRRASRWDLVWLLVSFLVYAPAVLVLRSGGPSERALFWATFGLLWVLLVALADDLLGRLRLRSRPAEAALPRAPSRAWRFAFYVAIFVTFVQFQRDVAGLAWLVALVVTGLGVVLVEKCVTAVARRRDEKRRREEVADLARQF